VALAGESVIAVAEIDTSYFLHNAPGWASLRGRRGDGEWFDLVPRTALQPDTRHRFVLGTVVGGPAGAGDPGARGGAARDAGSVGAEVNSAGSAGATTPVTHVRLDIFPDGGMARLRIHGRLTEAGRAALQQRWRDAHPPTAP
jgi:allantoicase